MCRNKIEDKTCRNNTEDKILKDKICSNNMEDKIVKDKICSNNMEDKISWEREIARCIKGDSIIRFHNYFKRYYKKHNPRDRNQIGFYFHISLIDYYQRARLNMILPSLYYKCFAIKNLKLTLYEHMHILVPLQHKIYCAFIKIRKLIDSRCINLIDNKFVNDSFEEEFNSLYNEYSKLNHYLVNLFFLKIKTRLKYLTTDDYDQIMSNLAMDWWYEYGEFPSKIIKIEFEIANYIDWD